MTIFQPDEFTRSFFDLPRTEHVLVDVGGHDPLAVKVQPARQKDCKCLIVLFHGALSRRNGAEVPAFLNFRRELSSQAHQISIADPGLEAENKVGIGWFVGSNRNPAQQLLPEFFRKVYEDLGLERVIFAGSSAGGFGAMYYSWNLPGSVVCASVPQTNIWEYPESGRRQFLRDCWPDGTEGVPNAPVLDLQDLYSTAVPNTVVYIQSSLDERQLHKNMIPFLAAVPVEERGKIALKVSYWGRPGHSGAVPPGELDGWLKAAVSAEEATAEAIVRAYQLSGVESTPMSQALMRDRGAAPVRSATGGERKQEATYQDLMWANSIAQYQLNERN